MRRYKFGAISVLATPNGGGKHVAGLASIMLNFLVAARERMHATSMHSRLRLGNRRRQLLREAARCHCIVSAGETRSEKSARQRASVGLVRAGLCKRISIPDLDHAGRLCNLVALKLTDAGSEVVRAWWPELRNGGTIRWAKHERRAHANAWRWHMSEALA